MCVSLGKRAKIFCYTYAHTVTQAISAKQKINLIVILENNERNSPLMFITDNRNRHDENYVKYQTYMFTNLVTCDLSPYARLAIVRAQQTCNYCAQVTTVKNTKYWGTLRMTEADYYTESWMILPFSTFHMLLLYYVFNYFHFQRILNRRGRPFFFLKQCKWATL